MARAIGMAEFYNVTAGVVAADTMAKTADVEIIRASAICPGKYVIIIGGELSAVKASIECCREKLARKLVDSFVLGNPHEDIFPAVYGCAEAEELGALGILEAFSAVSVIMAADTAAKTSQVKLLELRIGNGMSGKSYMYLTGSVAAVEAAIEKSAQALKDEGVYLDSAVIARPDRELWKSIL